MFPRPFILQMAKARHLRLVGQLRGLELFPQIFAVDLGIATELEDNETNGGFSEDEHDGD